VPIGSRRENRTQTILAEAKLLLTSPVFNTFPFKARSVQAGVNEEEWGEGTVIPFLEIRLRVHT